MTTLSRDREMSRDQSSVPNFASLMAKEELEDASCYYPASGRRSLSNLRGQPHDHSWASAFRPVTEHSGTGLGPLIPVPDWSGIFCSFRYRTDWMPDSLTFRHFKQLLLVVVKGIPSERPNQGGQRNYDPLVITRNQVCSRRNYA